MRLLLFLVIASVPLTVYAIVHDTLEVKGWGSNSIFFSNGLAAIGYGNSFASSGAHHSLAVGASNTINGGYSAAIGYVNTVSSYSLASGYLNNAASFSAALGRGIIADSTSVVVGSYNDPSEYVNERFVVGIGGSSGSAENGFVVLSDGSVIVPTVQGDVSMGIFGNP
jgi:hypothetical protein